MTTSKQASKSRTSGRNKVATLPDPKEVAKRKFFPKQIPVRDALLGVIEAVMADLRRGDCRRGDELR